MIEIKSVPKSGIKDQLKILENNQKQIAATIAEIYNHLVKKEKEAPHVYRHQRPAV